MKNPSSITIEDSMVLTFALVSLFLFPLLFFYFFKAKERFITGPSKENRWLVLKKNLKTSVRDFNCTLLVVFK